MPRTWRRFVSVFGQHPDAASASERTEHTLLSSRSRGVLSLLVVVVIIGLMALGFHTLAASRAAVQTSPATSATASATTVTKPNAPKDQWAVSVAVGTSARPNLAPSNPQMLYQLAAPGEPLRRSADHGTSWQSSSLPARQASQVNLYISPLDANTLFLSARYLSPPQDGAQCSETPENTPLAAGYDCVAQWVSVDGGAHWVTPHMPLGAPLADLAPAFWAGGPEFVQAQGHTLFGALYCHAPLCGNTGYRIVRSADGGLTWQFADAAIAAAQQYVCDVAPVAQGTTLFAVSAGISCTTALDQSVSGGGYDAFRLWRSDDAGQNWSQVVTLPAAVGGHLLVEPAPTGAQPLLYGNSLASADGGMTWQAAPTTGLPASVHTQVLGVRHDGSLLMGAIPTTTVAGQPVTETIFRWRAGDAAWQQVGQTLPGVVTSFTATQGATGQETLWVTVPMGPFSAANNGQLATPSSYQIESLLD